MAFQKQQYVAPTPPHRFVLKVIFSILGYPFNVIKKYNSYNARIGEIVNELDDDHLDRFRKNNGKLLLRFIYYPFFLSILISLFSIYHHFGEYQIFFAKLTKSYSNVDINAFTLFWKRIKFFFTKMPIRHDDYFYFIVGYVLMILGARFLMMNSAFKKEEEIARNFATLGYVDNEGKPWKFTWTPDAMMIDTFHCDVTALCNSPRFWSTINFPPGPPKLSKKSMGKFIVSKAYELPSALEFEYRDDRPVTTQK